MSDLLRPNELNISQTDREIYPQDLVYGAFGIGGEEASRLRQRWDWSERQGAHSECAALLNQIEADDNNPEADKESTTIAIMLRAINAETGIRIPKPPEYLSS